MANQSETLNMVAGPPADPDVEHRAILAAIEAGDPTTPHRNGRHLAAVDVALDRS